MRPKLNWVRQCASLVSSSRFRGRGRKDVPAVSPARTMNCVEEEEDNLVRNEVNDIHPQDRRTAWKMRKANLMSFKLETKSTPTLTDEQRCDDESDLAFVQIPWMKPTLPLIHPLRNADRRCVHLVHPISHLASLTSATEQTKCLPTLTGPKCTLSVSAAHWVWPCILEPAICGRTRTAPTAATRSIS